MSIRDQIRNTKQIMIEPNDIIKDNIKDNDNDITNVINKRRKKYTDINTRITIYIENEVAEQLDAICTEKGMKSQIVNDVLKDFFNKIKNKPLKWDDRLK